MTARRIDLGHAPVLALRAGYVGELGWEFHVPTEYLRDLYDRLMRAGAPARIRHPRRRLPGGQLAAAGEAVPGLGRRHQERATTRTPPAWATPFKAGQARTAGRTGAAQDPRRRARRSGCAGSPPTRGGHARRRTADPSDPRPRGQRAQRRDTATRSAGPSSRPTCRPPWPTTPSSSWRWPATATRPFVTTHRCMTRPAPGSVPEPVGPG